MLHHFYLCHNRSWLDEDARVGCAILSYQCSLYNQGQKYGHAQREAAPEFYVLTHSSTKDEK